MYHPKPLKIVTIFVLISIKCIKYNVFFFEISSQEYPKQD